jgi:hypothetical protein
MPVTAIADAIDPSLRAPKTRKMQNNPMDQKIAFVFQWLVVDKILLGGVVARRGPARSVAEMHGFDVVRSASFCS